MVMVLVPQASKPGKTIGCSVALEDDILTSDNKKLILMEEAFRLIPAQSLVGHVKVHGVFKKGLTFHICEAMKPDSNMLHVLGVS